MTSNSVVQDEVERDLQTLVEHLRDGPLQSLLQLQERADVVMPGQPSREDLIEALQSLVSLSLAAMLRFHTFNAELQRLVDRVANDSGEPAGERTVRSRLN